MKKFFQLISLTMFLVLFTTSCDGPVGPEGPVGAQGYGTNWKIVDLDVDSLDWKELKDNAGLNKYYTVNLSVPEITSTIYNDGLVIAYIEFGNTQQGLPYVRHFENSAGNMWTRTVDFDFQTNNVSFYTTNSDFFTDPPTSMHFRLVLMW